MITVLLLVLFFVGIGLYSIGNVKVAEIGRIVIFCSLLVFLLMASQHLQIDLVKRR